MLVKGKRELIGNLYTSFIYKKFSITKVNSYFMIFIEDFVQIRNVITHLMSLALVFKIFLFGQTVSLHKGKFVPKVCICGHCCYLSWVITKIMVTESLHWLFDLLGRLLNNILQIHCLISNYRYYGRGWALRMGMYKWSTFITYNLNCSVKDFRFWKIEFNCNIRENPHMMTRSYLTPN